MWIANLSNVGLTIDNRHRAHSLKLWLINKELRCGWTRRQTLQGFCKKEHFNHLLSQHTFHIPLHRPLMAGAKKICPYIYKQLTGSLKELQIFQDWVMELNKQPLFYAIERRNPQILMARDEWNPNKICHNYFLTCITLEYHILWTQCHSNGKEISTMNQLEHLNANMEGLHLICNFTVKNHIHSFKIWKASTTREQI